MTYTTDPIGDLLTRIRNAQRVRRAHCSAPWSRLKEQLCQLLVRDKWLASVEVTGEGVMKQLTLHFNAEKPALELKRISKPGRRVYAPTTQLKPILSGFGVAILTTSQGLLTDAEARRRKIGGEVLCTIA